MKVQNRNHAMEGETRRDVTDSILCFGFIQNDFKMKN